MTTRCEAPSPDDLLEGWHASYILQAARADNYRDALREIVRICSNDGIGNPIVDERVIGRCEDVATEALAASY